MAASPVGAKETAPGGELLLLSSLPGLATPSAADRSNELLGYSISP
jgi:hypothetical protein